MTTPKLFARVLTIALSLHACSLCQTTAADSGEFPPLSKKDYTPAGLGDREPELRVDFPGGATTRGIAKGSAVVAVMVDADGKAVDFQVIGCTDKAFGTALLDHARTRSYKAAKFKGARVPARFDVGYRFEAKNAAMNPMEQSRQLFSDTSSLAYSAKPEAKLDRPLEFVEAIVPRLPAGYVVPPGKQASVLVMFFVDEDGRVHVPSVQSAESPRLFAPALAAVRQWSFKPPMAGGKPALVYAGRVVAFDPGTNDSPEANGK